MAAKSKTKRVAKRFVTYEKMTIACAHESGGSHIMCITCATPQMVTRATPAPIPTICADIYEILGCPFLVFTTVTLIDKGSSVHAL